MAKTITNYIGITTLLLGLFISGCVKPYQPTQNNTTKQTTISAKSAFDAYAVDTANNFRQLAQNCKDGKYKYVAELVDESVKLDKISKVKRSQPIDKLLADELGSDELDKDKAEKVLLKIANNLDPKGAK